MRKLLLGAVALVAMAGAALADPLEGMWRTAADDNGNTGLIQVVPCGAALCGTLVKAFDGSGAALVTLDAALRQAEIVVVLVDHTTFKHLSPADLAGKLVFDTRGMLRR